MNNVSNLLGAAASPEVIAALIALAGVLVSVLISLSLGLATRKYNYNQLFAQTVSQSRNIWLNEMREYISTLIANAKMLRNGKCAQENRDECFQNYYKVREQIMLRLNLNEALHETLKLNIVELDKMIDKTDLNGFETIIDHIEELSQTILKEEWEKVKSEAKGKGEKKAHENERKLNHDNNSTLKIIARNMPTTTDTQTLNIVISGNVTVLPTAQQTDDTQSTIPPQSATN